MIILFPSEPFSPKEVDSSFKLEYDAAKLVGFEVFLFDHDEMVKTGNLKTNLPLNQGVIEQVILRSWMLNRLYYTCLQVSLIEKNYKLFNDISQYIQCHHFPEYYQFIMNNTTKAWWTNGWSEKAENVNWQAVRDFMDGDVIIKDYVKSEKEDPELFILHKELSTEEFSSRIHRFVEARGKLFNEGIVFKKIESLKKYEGHTNEWRLFFLNNELLMLNQNSDASPDKAAKPTWAITFECCEIAKKVISSFFTVDIAEKEDGEWMILEMGDGQVSGLPLLGDAIAFYNRMNNILNTEKPTMETNAEEHSN
jgi:hypothetical protein